MQAPDYDTTLGAHERRRLGAWYTPPTLVDHVVTRAIGTVQPGQTVRVLDPACGDGRFLWAAAAVIRSMGCHPVLTGADIDLSGLRTTVNSAAPPDEIEAIETDSLRFDWGERHFDVVVGNPPFLNQLATATARAGGSAFGGGTYADAAADFLALATELARPNGGRVGMVLPLSLLTTRDAGPIRRRMLSLGALDWFWWSPQQVFEASVRTCAVGFVRGLTAHPVPRAEGLSFGPTVDAPVPPSAGDHWGWLIADALGVPPVPVVQTNGTIADRGLVTANFRDQYYGLVGAVSDDADGPPLVTTGLIDVATCHWGRRHTRFAKQRFEAPRVDRTRLAPFMQRWADRCLVPKVLVATQTRVLEAVADGAGNWLPAVPVVRVVPHDAALVWSIAAVLTSPTASAIIAHQSAGSGLSSSTVRVSQRTLSLLGWPAGDLEPAVAALRAGDIDGCGQAVDAAYGVRDDDLAEWWRRGVTASS